MTRLRWWSRRRRRDKSDDPPWIGFIVSQTDPIRARSRDVSQLQFKVEGINNGAFDTFNLATHVHILLRELNFQSGRHHLHQFTEVF
jgi:hypothetical protein